MFGRFHVVPPDRSVAGVPDVGDGLRSGVRPRQHLSVGESVEQGRVIEVAHTPEDCDGAFAERHVGRVEVWGPRLVEDGGVVHGKSLRGRPATTLRVR
jgi:hypothetical protein